MGKKAQKPEKQKITPRMEGITGQDIKERIFADPKTGDDTEANLPSMEFLANGYNTGDPLITKEEILKSGTLLQKIRLFISSVDLSGYFEAEEQLSEDEEAQIANAIQTDEERKLSKHCVAEYNTIYDFGTRLSFFFKRFQTSFAILAVMLNRWDEYERTAEQLTILYSSKKIPVIQIVDTDENNIPTQTKDIDLFPESERKEFVNAMLHSCVLDGARLKFNEETERFFIDVDKKGGLYAQILKEVKSVSKDLSDFKAYAVVADDFVKKSTLKFMPTPILLSLDNAEMERYTRYLVKNRRYFRSELNQRKARGENISPEDEKRAVIPDFYEVKPSKNVLADCKAAIKKM